MNKPIARKVGLFFYLPTTLMWIFFPKQTLGNIYAVTIYLILSLLFIYLIFRKEPDKTSI